MRKIKTGYLKRFNEVTFALIALIVLIALISSFSSNNIYTNKNGAIGDVKYSILPPADFIRANGSGWILMDGAASKESKEIFENSILHDSLGLQILPDGRGMFVRGMNENRDPTRGDADGNRNVGSEQSDGLKKHQHQVKNIHGAVSPGGGYAVSILDKGDPNFSGASQDATGSDIYDVANQMVSQSNETRPRNIALYMYIKVN